MMRVELPTAVERFLFRGRRFFVKRDDLIDPLFSGNKFRKLYALIQTPAERYRQIISYGGGQSNAMLSMAALCKERGWEFHYTTKSLPQRLKEHPTGNLKMALELGMRLHEVPADAFAASVAELGANLPSSTLLLRQGGADKLAEAGITLLAEEIEAWRREHQIEKLVVVTPSGTGTTAFYLARALPHADIVTTPVVGDVEYLLLQMGELGDVPENVVMLEADDTLPFATPAPALLAIWQELKEAGIEFDLIYGARMWYVLMQHVGALEGTILYLHSGGVIGNETMLDRYRHMGLC